MPTVPNSVVTGALTKAWPGVSGTAILGAASNGLPSTTGGVPDLVGSSVATADLARMMTSHVAIENKAGSSISLPMMYAALQMVPLFCRITKNASLILTKKFVPTGHNVTSGTPDVTPDLAKPEGPTSTNNSNGLPSPAPTSPAPAEGSLTTGPTTRNDWLQHYYPGNDGFFGKPVRATLPKGMKISRYGGFFDKDGNFKDYGSYCSPSNEPGILRGLSQEALARPYRVYTVIKPFEVYAGQAIPWMQSSGGAIQYSIIERTNVNGQENPLLMQDLIEQGYIVPNE